MSETVIKAKNTFGGGLIMDFAPDNTQNSIMTNALNATLITYNGNEMSLQNDMGNSRVETARLPEGYIPVGSCEFGGIIYIVSYNPLIDKSQIGCFPSPERNFTSEELNDLHATLSGSELVDGKGKIIQTSVKKLLTSIELNPGDKFFINVPGMPPNWIKSISNFGNKAHDTIDWPKYVKLSLIAIEESGKINYLDSDLKWYDNNFWINTNTAQASGDTTTDLDAYRDLVGNNYSVFQSKVSGKLALLAELVKINEFSCAVKVRKSGVERIIGGNIFQDFNIYVATTWEADSNEINPSGFIIRHESSTGLQINSDPILANDEIYDSKKIISYNLIRDLSTETSGNFMAQSFEGRTHNKQFPELSSVVWDSLDESDAEDTSTEDASSQDTLYTTVTGDEIPLKDDVINNIYQRTVLKKIGKITVPKNTQSNTYSGSYTFTTFPCMDYGVLETLAVTNTINFADYGTNHAELTTWRYSLQDSTLSLNWGLKAMMDEDTNISFVKLTFYDALGECATKTISGYETYDGEFVEYLNLNSNRSFDPINSSSTQHVQLVGQPYTPAEDQWKLFCWVSQDYFSDTPKPLDPANPLIKPYKGESTQSGYSLAFKDYGYVYRQSLYLVKIDITRVSNSISSLPVITYYRWLWTNGMFNSQYNKTSATTTRDFDELPLNLNIDLESGFDGSNLQDSYQLEYEDCSQEKLDAGNNYKSLGSNTHYIGMQTANDGTIIRDDTGRPIIDQNSFITLKASPKLQNGYGCFLNLNKLNQFNVKIAIADASIELPESYEYEFTETDRPVQPYINPIIENNPIAPFSKQLSVSQPTDINQYKDQFKLLMENLSEVAQTFNYVTNDGQLQSVNTKYASTTLGDLNSNGFNIQLAGIKYNKIQAYESYLAKCNIMQSLLNYTSDLQKYNLYLASGQPLDFKQYIIISYNYSERDRNVGDVKRMSFAVGSYYSDTNSYSISYGGRRNISEDKVNGEWRYKESISSLIQTYKHTLSAQFVPILFGQSFHYYREGLPSINPGTVHLPNDCTTGDVDATSGDWEQSHIPAIQIQEDKSIDTYLRYHSLYADSNAYSASEKHKTIIGQPSPSNGWNAKYIPWVAGGTGAGIYTPGSYQTDSQTASYSANWMPTTLGIIENSTTYTLQNFFKHSITISNTPASSLATLTREFQPFDDTNKITPTNYAQLVGSLLGQLYYKSASEYSRYYYKNIISLKDFIETWKANILVSIEAPTDNTGSLVLLPNRMSIDDWISFIQAKTMPSQDWNSLIQDGSINLNNVTPKFQDGIQTVQLQYNDPYSVAPIISIYDDLKLTAMLRDFTDDNKLKPITTDISEGILYTYQNDQLLELSKSSSFALLENFQTNRISTGASINLYETPDSTSLFENATELRTGKPTLKIQSMVSAQKHPSEMLQVNIEPSAFTLKGDTMQLKISEYPQGKSFGLYWQYNPDGNNTTSTFADGPNVSGFRSINLFPYTGLV